MNPDLSCSESMLVNIRGREYPITISGSGIPCLAIGTGTLTTRTLSKRFKEEFKIYSSDLYWEEKQGLEDPTTLTMDMIVDDIALLGKELKLDSYIVIGHSAFGIVALEFAKKYPRLALGIIMIGTPVNSNSTVAEQNDRLFHLHADKNRKLIDSQRRALIAQEDLSKLSSSERFLREYIYRDAPRYWHIPDFDCRFLWEGITC